MISKIKENWALIGKLLAGVATVVLSFIIFQYAPGWLKIVALAAFVVILIAPPLLLRKTLPPDVAKALKDDVRKKHAG